MTTRNSITTGVAEEDHYYNWKIRNFNMVQKNEDLINKQNFEINTGPNSACHSLWNVGLKLNEGKTHIGFYCKLIGLPCIQASDVPMGFQIFVRYRDGNKIQKSVLKTLKLGESCGFGNVWTFDWPDWDRYTDLDSSLSIQVTLTIYAPVAPSRRTDVALQAFKNAALSKLQENFASMLGKDSDTLESAVAEKESTLGSGGDVQIVSRDDRVFPCHRRILSARSPYFAALFSSGFSESTTGVIKMDDLSGKTVKVILHYIYTGQLLECWLEPDVIVEFTYAAGKYQFEEVLELLDNLLGSVHEQASQTSVVLLELANKLSLKTAEAELLKRIVKFTVTAEKSEEFLSLIGSE